MSSNDYWRKREEEALKHYIKEEAEYDKEIERIYTDMLDSCNAQINAFYGKYAKAEGITLAEAKKRVSKLDIAEYERKAARYVKDASLDRKANGGKTNKQGYYFSEKANEEMRLYNLTMKVNRLEMLKANIGLEMIKGHAELETFMGDVLQGRTMEELERQAGILGKTIRNNAKLAHAIPNASFHNANFSDRVWMYHDIMKADLEKLLTSGLIQGKNPRQLARELEKYVMGDAKGGAKFNAERLMRTELARVQTEAQKQSFERNGFEKYIFIVNGGCCDICEEAKNKDIGHGKGVYLVKDMMPGENASPMHPHCRCSTAAYSDRKEYEEWLDFLEQGGTTEEYNKLKAEKSNPKVAYNYKNHKTLSNYDNSIEWANDDLQSNLEFCRGLPQKYHAPFDTFEKEIPKYIKQLSTALKKFDFATNTDSNAICSILKDGKLKGIVETKTSNGYNDISMRKDATSKLFSLYDDVDKLKPQDFEKYGYLDNAERAKNLYGDCRIVFKKENLWERTTFTVGDSLEGINNGANRVPSLVSQPNIVSLGTNIFSEDMPDVNNIVINTVQKRFDSIEKQGHFKGQISNQDYVELQFHGEITLDDIDYIEISVKSKDLKAIQELANQKNVKVKVIK